MKASKAALKKQIKKDIKKTIRRDVRRSVGKKVGKGVFKLLGKILTVGIVFFVSTFALYYFNLENKLIYGVIYPFLQKHYNKQNRDRKI